MNERTLRKTLSDIPLGGLRTFEQAGSTNDVALAWAADGAPDRGGRRWFTPPGTALAFSLVLRPLPGEEQSIPLFSGLGAMAVCEALGMRGLHPEIKWPNDVLLDHRKVCGVLAEAVWMGEKVDTIVLGIGINVKPEAVPPSDQLNFPATCLETEMGESVDRLTLLRDVLQALLYWRRLLTKDVFPNAWENYLAFRGEQVEIRAEGVPGRTGQLEGLERDGSLRLRSQDGQVFTVQFGEMHLRPVL
ncbi:MAG: biotin--[acetyl-CoA-carboxylase] ligase [Chloroflexi bacterium]|nr:biotin--[acetyl-CoA-carboxylase] ligase [Chloroflexota bacterium]